LDISKAFDAIDHTLLIEKIADSALHPNLIRWLNAYISGRKAWCVYNGAISRQFILRSGVPQGSVLSPALFNFFVSDCPSDGDIQDSYVDDFDLMESDSDLSVLDQKLQASVDSVVEWAKRKKLTIAPAKSQVTLFTPWNKQMHVRPNIRDS
jgi:hypothetical protein